jgi:hypothetical protein
MRRFLGVGAVHPIEDFQGLRQQLIIAPAVAPRSEQHGVCEPQYCVWAGKERRRALAM